jgi:hypothetical protein
MPIQELGLVVETDCDALSLCSALEGRAVTRENVEKFLFFPGCPKLGFQSQFILYDKPYLLWNTKVSAKIYQEDFTERMQTVGATYVLGCFGVQRVTIKLGLAGKALYDRGLRGQDVLNLFGDHGNVKERTEGRSEFVFKLFRAMAILDPSFVSRRNLPFVKKMRGYVLESHWVEIFFRAMRTYVADEIGSYEPGLFNRAETRLEIR